MVFVRPINDPDYWWHLRAGKQLVETRQLHAEDPWSLTAELDDDPGGPDELVWRLPPLSRMAYRQVILTGEWLSEVVLYGTYAAAGHRGTTAVALFSMMGALALAFLFVFRSGAPAALCVLSACVAAWELWGWGVPRPQIFTYVFAAGFVWLFDNLRRGRRGALVALPLLAILWSNAHGAYLTGLLVGLAFLGGEVGDRLLGRPSRPGLAGVGLLASLAGFALNPNGLNAVPASFVVKIALFSRTIAEWQAPGLDRWVFFVLLAFSALAIVTAVLARRAPLAHAFLVLGFGTMAATSNRHIPLFILLGLPAAVLALYRTAGGASRSFPALRRIGESVPAPQLVAFALAALSAVGLAWATRPHAIGVQPESVPVAMVEHLNQLPVPGPVFNEYRFGGYLLWALDPPRRLFIDGRSLSERANWEYDQTLAAQRPIFPFVFDRNDTRILALSLTSLAGTPSQLILEVTDDPEWVPTFVGPNSAVFVRRSALPDSGATRPGLKQELYRQTIDRVMASPADPVERAGNLALLFARLDVLDSARAYANMAFPPGSGAARVGSRPPLLAKALGEAAERAGRVEEAIAEYRRAADDPAVSASLALLLLRRAESAPAELGPALDALEAAVAAGTCNPAVHEALDLHGRSLEEENAAELISRGRYLGALHAAGSLPGDAAQAEFFRGVALLRLCRYGEAQQAFRRSAEYDGGLQSAPSTTLVNLGWALFDGGRPQDALAVFETLLARHGEEPQALFGAGLASKFSGRRTRARTFFLRYLEVAAADDAWAGRVRDNLAELEQYPYFRGL